MILIIGTILITQISAKKKAPENFEVPVDRFVYTQLVDNKPVNIKAFNAIKLNLGTGKEKTQSDATFFLDFGTSDFLIGDLAKYSHGIDCSDVTKNSCEHDDSPITQKYRFNKEFDTVPGRAFFRLEKDSLEVDNPKIEKAPFSLITGRNSWYLNNWGVIGLAPQGPLSKYLNQIYEGPLNFKLNYTTNKDIGYDLKVTLNPKLLKEEVLQRVEIDSKSQFWSVAADVNFIDKNWSFKQTPLCISSNDENIIAVIDQMDRCDAVKKIICNGLVGPDCKKSNSDFSKAPKLEIKIGEKVYSFNGTEYLYYLQDDKHKDQVECRWGDAESLRNTGTCDELAEVGIGLKFLEKYPIVLSLEYGKNSAITFVTSYQEDRVSVLGKWVLAITFVLIFLIGGYLIYKTVFQNKQKKEDEYIEA